MASEKTQHMSRGMDSKYTPPLKNSFAFGGVRGKFQLVKIFAGG
jgi:hypothetical protein